MSPISRSKSPSPNDATVFMPKPLKASVKLLHFAPTVRQFSLLGRCL
ncbi:MAG: hypothetical protein ACUVV4_03280 [Candidatus Bathyarchaeia archaeon]